MACGCYAQYKEKERKKEVINTPSYMKVFKPPKSTNKPPPERRVWSIGLTTVLVPFFTAGNAVGDKAVSPEALGCPLRLGYDKAGAVRFTPLGKPVIRVAKEITDAVSLIREDIVADMKRYISDVQRENADGFKAQLELNHKLGTPIKQNDDHQLDLALQALAEAAAKAAAEAVKAQAVTEAVAVAEAHAEAEAVAVVAEADKPKGRNKRELVTA